MTAKGKKNGKPIDTSDNSSELGDDDFVSNSDDDLSSDDEFDLSNVQDVENDAISIEAKLEAKSRQHQILKEKSEEKLARAFIYDEPDLILRARLLSKLGQGSINFYHYQQPKKDKNKPIEIALRPNPSSEMNRMAVYDALYDYGSGIVPFPHHDTFCQRLIDEYGEPLTSKNIRVRELMTALNVCGMDNPRSIDVINSLKSWAADHRYDFLQGYFNKTIPKWDGVKRTESKLIELFGSADSELNRMFSQYFWLSIYNRILNPGCLAPISLALIGPQNSGKSYFSKILCRTLMGDDKYGPVSLDLSVQNYNNFLRDITGESIIANVGEKIGLKRGELDRIKEFVSKESDDLNFKFEGSIKKLRQWIIIMDGNSYDGLQKDETGNRRFYPMFVGQIADRDGQPAWKLEYSANFANFKEEVWQIMAECREMMNEKKMEGYEKFVSDLSVEISRFSSHEKKALRGVVKDSFIETNIQEILLGCEWKQLKKNSKEPGWFTTSYEICQQFIRKVKKEPFSKSLKLYMESMGFVAKQVVYRGFFLPTEMDHEEFFLYILRSGRNENVFDAGQLEDFKEEYDRIMKQGPSSF